MIDIEIQISISERSSGWAINYRAYLQEVCIVLFCPVRTESHCVNAPAWLLWRKWYKHITYGRIALHWINVLRWLIYFHRENQQRKVMGSLIASEQICMRWSFHIWGESFYGSWMWLYHLWLVWHSICLTVDLPYWSYSFQESQLSGLIYQLYMVIFNPPLSDGYI